MWGNWCECSKNSWWKGILFADRFLIQQISNQSTLFLMLQVNLVIKMIFNNKWKTSKIFYKKKKLKNRCKEKGKINYSIWNVIKIFSE